MSTSKKPAAEVPALAAELIARLRGLTFFRTQQVRAIRREFSKRLAPVSAEDVLAVALEVMEQTDCRWVAYELVCYHRAALRSLGVKELHQFGRGMASWGEVDSFACYLAGPAWRERQVPDRLLDGWAVSKDRWWRRAALVSTVPLNNKARGGNGDIARTLEVCRLLVKDSDDMVVKAMSWALREAAKRDPAAVRRFLAGHESVLAARVLREVRSKLRTGLKNPRRVRGR
jgi:3-methyladenine DNA glycosylase AlkD